VPTAAGALGVSSINPPPGMRVCCSGPPCLNGAEQSSWIYNVMDNQSEAGYGAGLWLVLALTVLIGMFGSYFSL
jgi:hypothetical protein